VKVSKNLLNSTTAASNLKEQLKRRLSVIYKRNSRSNLPRDALALVAARLGDY
jgi:hypothetical protein